MSILASKFRVLRGWKPGDVIPAVDNVQAHATAGVIDTLPGGTIVTRLGDGTWGVPASVVTAANKAITSPDIRIVLSGTDDFDSIATSGLMVVGRGNLRVRVSNLAAAQTFPVGGAVSYNTSGQFTDASTNMVIGHVNANNVNTDGTIDIDLALN